MPMRYDRPQPKPEQPNKPTGWKWSTPFRRVVEAIKSLAR